jgi:hypothetical protein
MIGEDGMSEEENRSEPQKPIDRWLGLLSIVFSIVFFLLPKTPVTVLTFLVLIPSVLLHVIWNLPWVERAMVRRGVAVLVLLFATVGLGFYVWPRVAFSYPWIHPMLDIDESGKAKTIRFELHVRRHPASAAEAQGLLPIASLEHVHLEISAPLTVDPDSEGWDSCQVVRMDRQEWDNYGDATSKPLASYVLATGQNVFMVRASSRDATWGGLLLVDTVNQTTDEFMAGRALIQGNQVALSIRETTRAGSATRSNNPQVPNITKGYLIEHGVPPRTQNSRTNACGPPKIYQFFP